MRSVLPGQNPDLEREARRKGACRDEALALEDDAPAVAALLAHDIAEDAALLEPVVAVCAAQLLLHIERNDWQRDQLRVRMFQAGARFCAVILEHDRVAKALILREVE